MWRSVFYISAGLTVICIAVLSIFWHATAYLFLIVVPLIAVGIYDINSSSVAKNSISQSKSCYVFLFKYSHGIQAGIPRKIPAYFFILMA